MSTFCTVPGSVAQFTFISCNVRVSQPTQDHEEPFRNQSSRASFLNKKIKDFSEKASIISSVSEKIKC